MRKFTRFIKFIAKIWKIFWVRLVVIFGAIVAICAAAGAFNSAESFGDKIAEVLTSGDILLTFLIAAVSLIVARVTMLTMSRLEDAYKLEENQKKIIVKYYDHKKTKPGATNFYTPDGAFMYISFPPKQARRRPRNPQKKHTEDFDIYDDIIQAYLADDTAPSADDGYALYLPGVNVFANVEGNARVRFVDRDLKKVPPGFVRENALALMEAHKTSNYSNNETIRLKDVTYDPDRRELSLFTERTQYFDMLITNRCIDYKLNGLISVRDVYEGGKTITPLKDSELSNQIGINGLIFTADGYLLLEKRGYKKSIWKGKLAQPISLAMKKRATNSFLKDGVLTPDYDGDDSQRAAAEHAYVSDVFKKIIFDTISDNFGLTEDDIRDFDISKNMFGVARDLLEGGKPNIYFYVIVNITADECKKTLEDRAKRSAAVTIRERKQDRQLPNLTYDKIDSDYYLVHCNDIGVDFNYNVKVKAKNIKKVGRKFFPMVNRLSAKADGLAYRTRCRFGVSMKEECGDALLACFYYMGACRERLKAELELAHTECVKQKEV